MPPVRSTTEVFAFSAPKINSGGGAINFAISVGAGQQHVLTGTRSVWRGLARHLVEIFPEFVPQQKKLATSKGPLGKREELYAQIEREWLRGDGSQKELSLKYGVVPNTFVAWRTRKLAAGGMTAGAAPAPAPITKPGGHLL